jgi:hypothetical protein
MDEKNNGMAFEFVQKVNAGNSLLGERFVLVKGCDTSNRG